MEMAVGCCGVEFKADEVDSNFRNVYMILYMYILNAIVFPETFQTASTNMIKAR